MKLSDIKGERALDALADLIEPATEIMSDKKVVEIYRSDSPKIALVKYIIKEHKQEIVEILAILEDEDPKEYVKKINIVTLPLQVLDLFNDPELLQLFSSQEQIKTSSGPAMENTEVEKK